MRRNRGGFTILEVMIFLAISGAMLAAAMVAISGQQTRTEFTQGMRDIDSKLQDTLNDVSNGNFNYGNNGCTVTGTGAVALSGGNLGVGSNQACLFLGEAVQFNANGSTTGVANNTRFATYTVLGRRLKQGSIAGAQLPVSSFSDAIPTTQLALTNYYSFENGITTKAVYYTPQFPVGSSQTINTYTLLGLYTSFTSAADNVGNSGADASQSLQAYVYKAGDGVSYGTSAKTCIDANDPTKCAFDQNLSSSGSKGWGVCFDSNNGSGQTALITIYNTSEGVSTRLDYNPVGIC